MTDEPDRAAGPEAAGPEPAGPHPAEPPPADPPPPAEREPDYRFTLANERTYLAWVRTALALLAGAVAVGQLVPPFRLTGAREALAVLLAALAVAVAVLAVRRWRFAERAMRRDLPLPRLAAPWLLSAGLAAAALFVLVLLLLRPTGPS